MTVVAAMGAAIGGPASAVAADPGDPYSGLSCSCPSQDSPHRFDLPDVTEGIKEGLAGRRAPQPEASRRLAGRATPFRQTRIAGSHKPSPARKTLIASPTRPRGDGGVRLTVASDERIFPLS